MTKDIWMSATLRFALVAGLVVLAATCKPDAVADPASEVKPTGTPLPQLAMIPVQIELEGGTWASVHVPEAAAERMAQKWCREWRQVNDEDACPFGLRSPEFDETSLDGTALAGGADGTPGATFAACREEGLCKLRNELCAGYLLAEAARSPVQRVLGGDRSMTPFELDESMLAIPQVERASLPRDMASTKRVRLQPLTGPGRAAALRGATHRFQEAARIAHYFHTWDTIAYAIAHARRARWPRTAVLRRRSDEARVPRRGAVSGSRCSRPRLDRPGLAATTRSCARPGMCACRTARASVRR